MSTHVASSRLLATGVNRGDPYRTPGLSWPGLLQPTPRPQRSQTAAPAPLGSRGPKPKITQPADRRPAHRQRLLRESSLVDRKREHAEASFTKPLSPFMELHPREDAITSQRSYLPPNTVALRIRFQHRIWGTQSNSQHSACV